MLSSWSIPFYGLAHSVAIYSTFLLYHTGNDYCFTLLRKVHLSYSLHGNVQHSVPFRVHSVNSSVYFLPSFTPLYYAIHYYFFHMLVHLTFYSGPSFCVPHEYYIELIH